jgi:hypothetical protein
MPGMAQFNCRYTDHRPNKSQMLACYGQPSETVSFDTIAARVFGCATEHTCFIGEWAPRNGNPGFRAAFQDERVLWTRQLPDKMDILTPCNFQTDLLIQETVEACIGQPEKAERSEECSREEKCFIGYWGPRGEAQGVKIYFSYGIASIILASSPQCKLDTYSKSEIMACIGQPVSKSYLAGCSATQLCYIGEWLSRGTAKALEIAFVDEQMVWIRADGVLLWSGLQQPQQNLSPANQPQTKAERVGSILNTIFGVIQDVNQNSQCYDMLRKPIWKWSRSDTSWYNYYCLH